MNSHQKLMTDTEIICMIEQNDPLGWDFLYDKYALMMYVAILWVIDEEQPAEGILIMIFFQLKADKSLLETKKSLCQSLLYHTCMTSSKISENNDFFAKKDEVYNEMFSMSMQ